MNYLDQRKITEEYTAIKAQRAKAERTSIKHLFDGVFELDEKALMGFNRSHNEVIPKIVVDNFYLLEFDPEDFKDLILSISAGKDFKTDECTHGYISVSQGVVTVEYDLDRDLKVILSGGSRLTMELYNDDGECINNIELLNASQLKMIVKSIEQGLM
jgi:hypothetical protein